MFLSILGLFALDACCGGLYSDSSMSKEDWQMENMAIKGKILLWKGALMAGINIKPEQFNTSLTMLEQSWICLLGIQLGI